jgi:hypothetical protein
MPYQYKREPLNNDEVNKLTNSCGTLAQRYVIVFKRKKKSFIGNNEVRERDKTHVK